MTTRPEHWLDNLDGYGYITRFLHWSMALLFSWQLITVVMRVLAKDTEVATFFWRTHYPLGFTLFLLVLLRGAWGLFNLRRRPGHHGLALGKLAPIGHFLLYALMIVVPALAILRAYGRGRGFSPYGITVFDATGVQIPALVAPGNLLHGWLGWTLFALIGGHIAIALVHRLVWRDHVFQRMARTTRIKPVESGPPR